MVIRIICIHQVWKTMFTMCLKLDYLIPPTAAWALRTPPAPPPPPTAPSTALPPPPPPTSSPGSSSPDLIDMTPGEMVELFSAAGKATVPPNVASRGQGQIQGHSRKPLPPPPSARAAPRPKYKCIMSFPASTEYELDLKEGDVVILLKKREDGWAKGMLERSGSTGLFPMTFVQLLS